MNLALPFTPFFPRHARYRFPAPTFLRPARPAHTLPNKSILDLGNAQGLTLTCMKGSIWLTHDGDPKDVVLEAGQSHAVTRSARLIAQGLEDAELRAD